MSNARGAATACLAFHAVIVREFAIRCQVSFAHFSHIMEENLLRLDWQMISNSVLFLMRFSIVLNFFSHYQVDMTLEDMRARRIRLKMTQKVLENRVGVDVCTIRRWDNGVVPPSSENVCEVLEL